MCRIAGKPHESMLILGANDYRATVKLIELDHIVRVATVLTDSTTDARIGVNPRNSDTRHLFEFHLRKHARRWRGIQLNSLFPHLDRVVPCLAAFHITQVTVLAFVLA